MSFRGFGEKAIPFLKALDFHQSREWFAENKPLFESELKRPLEALVETLAARFAAAGYPFTGSPKASLFRIYRDVRFAKDKSPFNRHVSAILNPHGDKSSNACFYVHVGLDRRFAAMGWYGPEPEDLARFRRSILTHPERFAELTAALAAKGLPFDRMDAAKRLPKGFETVADPVLAEAVKLKHFIVERDLDDARLTSPGLVEDLMALADDARPLLDWGLRVTA